MYVEREKIKREFSGQCCGVKLTALFILFNAVLSGIREGIFLSQTET
jgi:hypothetical protein